MLFERYMIKRQDDIGEVFDIDINEGLFENISIDDENYEFCITKITHSFDNSAYDNLIVLYTKPNIVYRTDQDFTMYSCKIAYVKTKDNQLIVNVNDWDVVNHLDRYQGLIDFIEVFFIPYDSCIKIAIEYKYQSVAFQVLTEAIQLIIKNGFILSDIDFNSKLEIVKDYFKTDFENTFNNATKNKKLIFHIDLINDLRENINSAKIEYSIKSDNTLENTMSFVATQWADNISRYTIKCQDRNDKMASIDGSEDSLLTEEWMQAARTNIDITDLSEGSLSSLSHFLRVIEDD